MDLLILAQALTSFLVCLLPPYLLKAGGRAVEEMGEKFGADAWEWAKGLNGHL